MWWCIQQRQEVRTPFKWSKDITVDKCVEKWITDSVEEGTGVLFYWNNYVLSHILEICYIRAIL
jgi:hypothetical protein